MINYTSIFQTTQTEPALNKQQVKNNAGGFVFGVDKWKQLERFLILGTEGGSYYVKERELTLENAKAALACLEYCGSRVVDLVVDISTKGRAFKQDAGLFVLALAASHEDELTRKKALEVLPIVARTGTHLFTFTQYVNDLRGWGRGLKKAVGNWYTSKDPEKLAYQLIKYKSRGGWSHRDLLRLSHIKTSDEAVNALLNYAVKGYSQDKSYPKIISASHSLVNFSQEDAAGIIKANKLPREVVPTEYLNNPVIWEALLADMPLMATVRNLGKMTSIGLLKPFSPEVSTIVDRLNNERLIEKSKMHPMHFLVAYKTYISGHGDKGSLSWTPVPQISEALEDAYYKSFKYVEPSGKRIMLALDVSGSMSTKIQGTSISSCEASATLALTIAKTEPNYFIHGFAHTFKPLKITKNSTLAEAIKEAQDNNFGRTDCSLAMQYAIDNKLAVDAFVVFTDSETYAGNKHPYATLQQYRKVMGIDAKLIVVATESNGFSIADPADPGMLDVVGFDPQVPLVITEFIKGDSSSDDTNTRAQAA